MVWILNLETLEDIQKMIGECDGIKELVELFSYVKSKDVIFDASLARGLSYYTGTVFEVVLKNSKMESSVAGGGRYDDMIGGYVGGRQTSAVGVSFGVSRIMDAIEKKGKKTLAQVYVIPIGNPKNGLKIVKSLRDAGISADVDLIGRGVTKNLNYVDALEIPYAVFVGDKEMKLGKVKLKDMKTGKESMIGITSVIKKILP